MIGILAVITIVAYNGIQERAKVQRANSALNSLAKAIYVSRISQNKTLQGITGSFCTACSGHAVYLSTLDLITSASGANLSGLKAGDPWGNDYAIDENELENMAVNQGCNTDHIGVSTAHTGIQTPTITTYTC